MKAIDYINKNLPSLNRVILNQLLGNESVELTNDMWDYLSNSPWNTNRAILKSNWGLDLKSGEDSGEWTTIRLEKIKLTASNGEEEWTEYLLGNQNIEDINNYKKLYSLWENNQHPIIKVNGKIYANETELIFNNELATIININDNNNLLICGQIRVFCFDLSLWGYDAGETVLTDNELNEDSTDYLEIQYKIGDYYTLTINEPSEVINSLVYYVVPNSSWIINYLGDLNYAHLVLFDGTNVYHEGDIIQFTSDMILEVISDSDLPINPGDDKFNPTGK